jgi:hypothetical protein
MKVSITVTGTTNLLIEDGGGRSMTQPNLDTSKVKALPWDAGSRLKGTGSCLTIFHLRTQLPVHVRDAQAKSGWSFQRLQSTLSTLRACRAVSDQSQSKASTESPVHLAALSVIQLLPRYPLIERRNLCPPDLPSTFPRHNNLTQAFS